jgi:DNA modification methylase
VLDAFGGSGTTLVAAEQTGRRGRAIEFDPLYVDTIVKRMQSLLKVEATLGHGTATFKSTAAWRASGIE